MQLYVSYIQPSFKLLVKVRGEVWVIRRYSPPALLCDRVLKHGETSAEVGGSSEKPGRTRPSGTVSPHQGGAVYDGSDVLVSAPGNSPRNMSSLELGQADRISVAFLGAATGPATIIVVAHDREC